MTDIVLVYPYFNEELDRSIFRYPPLGLGYLASILRIAGFSVDLVDCTFLHFDTALRRIEQLQPRILGIYSMVTINHHAIMIAQKFRSSVELMVAGGPLPSLVPEEFLDIFDIVVLGEGEETVLELVRRHFQHTSWTRTSGIAYKGNGGRIKVKPRRRFIKPLDSIPLPARDLFPNSQYKWYWRTFHHYTASSMISTRGCPYLCDFCSNPVFGQSYRERSAKNVVEEMVLIRNLGYDRVFFTDDCFTQNPHRVAEICEILIRDKQNIEWMCLSRADHLSKTLATQMQKAGCRRIFFGIESGNQSILNIIGKRITLEQVRRAVENAQQAGIETGGFFILGYPGETNETLLDTLNFSSKLPLDYLSYSFPYPIFGTGLYSRVQNQITVPDWRKQRGSANRHDLLFKSAFSENKLRLAMYAGLVQHRLRKNGALGKATAKVAERFSNYALKLIR
ncbi:MAG: B12-binding domain-containing radical SAM protein [Promethearchaeota archaeon]